MKYRRGDILLAKFPHADGTGSSRRPVLVVQNDIYNAVLDNTIVAQITSNLKRRDDPAHLFIEHTSSEGQTSGLLMDSLVSCNNLATLHESVIDRKIGELSAQAMQQVDDCLKTSLGIT